MHTDVAAVLIDVEAELRRLDLWQSQPPSAQALASQEPFAIDTLSLPEWLQFIFLPTMYQLIGVRAELPAQCGIAPMAEEYFRDKKLAAAALLDALKGVDTLLSGGESGDAR
jgi:uncharacterized protein YqcC (DUF446 family)